MTLIDLTLVCPTCGRRADACFDHGEEWKTRGTAVHRMTEHELRAGVNEFTEDDPPPYGARGAVSAADYHADRVAERPSLSASLATILCASSPRHAWAAHPRLNPDYQRVEEDKFSIGTVTHQLLLEGTDSVEVVEYDSWRTNDAKTQRVAARAAGRIPLLIDDWTTVQAMITSVREQLDALDVDPPLLTDGKPEQTLVWEDEGVTCRSRLDWLRDDLTAITDVKTTSRSASPESFSRNLFGTGADIQAAFYLRGMEKVFGRVEVEYRWLVIETYPPYALSVVSPGPDVLTLARKKVSYAIDVWRRCLVRDEWPAYPARVCWADLPAYEENRWLWKEEREAA